MKERDGPNRQTLWTKAEKRMKRPAPMVGESETVRVHANQSIDPLRVDTVGDKSAVGSLCVPELLHGGVEDGREENSLEADDHVSSIQSTEATSKVPVGVSCNDVGQLMRCQPPTLYHMEELRVGGQLLRPP